ncbi:MAG: hypothetical protein IPM29_18050 [Planctomycetes bacterium]|nr:hypothetical protein [Planctomycetota bacterium]
MTADSTSASTSPASIHAACSPRLCLPAALALLVLLVLSGSVRAQSDAGLTALEREFAAARADYLEVLGEYLPGAYRERFAGLTRDELATIAATRRLWQWYIDEGPFTMGDPRKQSTGIFREEFLDPMDRVAEILLIDPEEIRDTAVRRARAEAFKLGEKLMRARERSGVDIDPTAERTAPTGIPYPRLDRPHTCVDVLRLYERTLVLAKTVAHPGAEAVLMQNAEACAEVDLMEADFVMYANQVRMLSGSIAWVCDPLMTACCRDHSADRKAGLASGHQSTIEGKRFPRDRAERFGCRVGPEGAGGGRTGREAIRGFAYDGTGHGGPLFARLRNVVGPGQREGALTAMYQTDDRLKHPCQASEGELILPPGVTSRMLDAGTRAIFRALASGRFEEADSLLGGREPSDDFQKAVHRYLAARLEAEVDWTLTGIEHILDAGDAYEADQRLQVAERTMDGIAGFDQRAGRLRARLAQRGVAQEIKVGRIYQQIIGSKRLDRDKLQRFVEEFPESAYAAAGRHCLEAGDGAFWPELFHFVMQDTHLNKWSYLQPERIGGR